MFGTLISLLLVDMRILTSRGPVSLSDGQDSFLCYLPSKITRPPAQYPLLFPPRGKQAARGPYVRLSGCISISRPSLIIEMNKNVCYIYDNDLFPSSCASNLKLKGVSAINAFNFWEISSFNRLKLYFCVNIRMH